jgi:hypothetical protein
MRLGLFLNRTHVTVSTQLNLDYAIENLLWPEIIWEKLKKKKKRSIKQKTVLQPIGKSEIRITLKKGYPVANKPRNCLKNPRSFLNLR